MPRSLGKWDVVLLHRRGHVLQPSLGDKLVRLREDVRVPVLVISGHADGDARGNHPFLELEGKLWGNTRTAVEGTVAETVEREKRDTNQTFATKRTGLGNSK